MALRCYGRSMSNSTPRTITSRSDIPAVIRELEDAVDAGPAMVAVIPANRGLSPAQAGKVLGVSRQFVDRLIAQEKLQCVHLPGSSHRRIPVVEIERFVRERDERKAAQQQAVIAMDSAQVPWE